MQKRAPDKCGVVGQLLLLLWAQSLGEAECGEFDCAYPTSLGRVLCCREARVEGGGEHSLRLGKA